MENINIPQDFKLWYLAESRKQPTTEAYKKWKRRGQQLCFEVAYTQGYQDASEAAYRHLSCQPPPGLRERLQERITTLEQKYEARGFEENYGDIMKRGGIFYLKQVLEWLEETPAQPANRVYPEGGGEGEEKPNLKDAITWLHHHAQRNGSQAESNEEEVYYQGYVDGLNELAKEMELSATEPAPEAQPIADNPDVSDINVGDMSQASVNELADGKEVPEEIAQWIKAESAAFTYSDRPSIQIGMELMYHKMQKDRDKQLAGMRQDAEGMCAEIRSLTADLLAARNKNNDDAIEIARLQGELKEIKSRVHSEDVKEVEEYIYQCLLFKMVIAAGKRENSFVVKGHREAAEFLSLWMTGFWSAMDEGAAEWETRCLDAERNLTAVIAEALQKSKRLDEVEKEMGEYRTALVELMADVRNKPNDTRYATHMKKAQTVLDKYPSPTQNPDK